MRSRSKTLSIVAVGIVALIAAFQAGASVADSKSGVSIKGGECEVLLATKSRNLNGIDSQSNQPYYLLKKGIKASVAQRLLVRAETRSFFKLIMPSFQEWDVKLLSELAEDGLFLLTPKNDGDLYPVCEQLRLHAAVRYVQPDLLIDTHYTEAPYYDMEGFELERAINLQSVWTISKGKGVVIAVIDDGFVLNHPDLQGINIRRHIEVDHKTNLHEASNTPHGTKVVGVIFSQHNGFGVNGVAPEANLVAVSLQGSWTSQLVLAIEQAILAGADIVNASWTMPFVTQPLRDVIGYHAQSGRDGKGVIFVVAAGNRNQSKALPDALANLPWVVSVAHTDHALQPMVHHYPVKVNIAAPGMLETVSNRPTKPYIKIGGSSSAAPVISGVAALVLAVAPEISRSQLQELLLNNADAISNQTKKYNYGIVNAGRVIQAAIQQTARWAAQ